MMPPGPPPPPPQWQQLQQAPPHAYHGAPPPLMPLPPAMAGVPTDSKATISLVLGVMSIAGIFCYMGAFLGIPAIILGFMSRAAIKKSDGSLGGQGVATAGIVTGFIGTGVWLAIVAIYVALIVAASSTPTPTPYPTTYTTPIAPTATAYIPPGGFGSVHVIDLHASGGSLRSQLTAQASESSPLGETILVMTVARDCTSCNEVAVAMTDPRMQAALASVVVVRVDTTEFSGELRSMKMLETNLPWFYLLDSSGAVKDRLSSDEWDDNVAKNIAPVLEAFVEGKLTKRRHP